MIINSLFDFILECGNSKKGNNYYGIYILSKDKTVKKLIAFLTKSEYENIQSLLEKK